MPRLPRRKWYWEGKQRRKGEMQAEREMHRTKPWMQSLKEHIGKWIDSGEIIDVAAIGVGTFLVHGIIVKHGFVDQALTWWLKAEEIVGSLGSPLVAAAVGAGVFPKEISVMPEDSMQLWLTSFFIAFLIVKFGGQMLGLWERGLVGAVQLMFSSFA